MDTSIDRARRAGPDLAALLVVTIWGTNFAFLKLVLAEFDPLTFLTLRFVGMLALGWSVVLWQARRGAGQRLGVPRSLIPRLILAGILGHTLYLTLSLVGLAYTTAFSSALLIAVAPVFAALLLWALRMERVGGNQWLGMAVSIFGIMVFMAEKFQQGAWRAGLGDVISLIGALCFAAYTVVNKPLLARLTSAQATTYTMTVGAIPALFVGLPVTLAQDWSRVTVGGWATLAWSIVFPVWFAWTVWAWAGAKAGVARTSLFMYLVPIIGGVASWFLLGESFTLLKLLGAALTLAGLAVARRRAVSPAPRPLGKTAHVEASR